jgi:hypothetical protein
MEVSARAYLAAGISLTAATAIAFTPVVVPIGHAPVELPRIATANVRLAAAQGDAIGVPDHPLTAAVGNLVTAIDRVFTRAIDATDDPDQIASLTILEEFTHDAFAMLHHNLGRANAVNTATAAEARELLLAGEGLEAIHAVAEDGVAIVGISRDELTFQFHNAVTRLSELGHQLADAYGPNIVKSVAGQATGRTTPPAQNVVTTTAVRTSSLDRTSHPGLQRLPLTLRVDPATRQTRPLASARPSAAVASPRHSSAGTFARTIRALRNKTDRVAPNADGGRDTAERPARHRR